MSGTLFAPPPIDRKKTKEYAQRIEKLIIIRRKIIEEIKKFEEKYNLNYEDFYVKWSKGLIPEPEDPEIHEDFLIWSALIEELYRIERELTELLSG